MTAWCQGGDKNHLCPNGFDLNCNVPDNSHPKPKCKPKVRRVKAWAITCGNGITASTNWIGFEGKKPPHTFHCTILINEKWLKGAK